MSNEPATRSARTRVEGSQRQVRVQSNIVGRQSGTDAQSEMLSFFRGDESKGRERETSNLSGGTVATSRGLSILQPWFIPSKVAALPAKNNILGQCIAAMVTNCEGFGHQLEYIGPEDQEDSDAAKAEAELIRELIDQPNGDYDMVELREKLRNDLEHSGNAYMEIVEDEDGTPALLYHLDALTMNLTALDDASVEVEQPFLKGGREVTRKVKRKFRRFVQTVGTKKTYFKEFGDPRVIDADTGEVTTDTTKAATAVIHIKLPDMQGVYGVPRWLAQLPAILGSRESELTNLQFFKDNAIPAMVLLVSGGYLTSNSAADIYSKFNDQRGRASQNRLLVIEAAGDAEAASDNGTIPPPRVDLKPLGQERQSDALFQNYDEENRKKIRSSFRLPPLFIGLAEDHTFASSNASLAFAESQVFGPERQRIDRPVEKVIRAKLGRVPKFWRYKSNAPSIADPGSLVTALTTFNNAGALTPNAAIQIANELFDLRMPRIQEPWGNRPFELTKLFAQGTLALPEAEEDVVPDEPGTAPKPDRAKAANREAAPAQRMVELVDGITYRVRTRARA